MTQQPNSHQHLTSTPPQLTISFIQTLLTLPTTLDISSRIKKEYASSNPVPESLVTSCITYFLKNSPTDPEKIQVFCNLLLKVHTEAIAMGYGVVNVYENLKNLLLKYTVNAPPYSVELYTLNDFKVMSIWICEIYLKHYKMWLYRDGRKELATVAVVPVEDLSRPNLLAGVDVHPLGESLPEDQWLQQEEERKQQEEEQQKLQEQDEAAAKQEEEELQNQEDSSEQEAPQQEEEPEEERKPHQDIGEREEPPDIKNAYIKKQLEEIKNMLLQFSDDKLGNVEERLKNIEATVQQQEEESQQNTKGKGKKK